VEKSGMPFTTTLMAKSIIDENNEILNKKWIGTFADLASTEAVRNIMWKRDPTPIFLFLGTIITDDYLDFITDPTVYGNMILATDDTVRVGKSTYQDVLLQDFIAALANKFQEPIQFKAQRSPDPWKENADTIPHCYGDDRYKVEITEKTMTFNRFFDKLTNTLNLSESVLTFGVSTGLYVSSSAYNLPQNSFIASAVWQCTGFETGAALGAQLSSGKRAWAIAGDGGFMMVCQALSTLARYKLNSVIVVINNSTYAIEQGFVNACAYKEPDLLEQFNKLPIWDYHALAAAFGADHKRVCDATHLEAILKEIVEDKSSQKPTLLEVVINWRVLPQQFSRLLEFTNCCKKREQQ